MADLYERLGEIQEMIRILVDDVDRLRTCLGERSIQAAVSDAEEGNRRFYVRAVFALAEAVVEQHKQLLLDLDDLNKVPLEVSVRGALSERVNWVTDNGKVREREQYLPLRRKLRAVCRAAGDAFDEPLGVDFGDQGWEAFQAALEIRDRITHPKTSYNCYVNEIELNLVDQGLNWFRKLHNEFVRVASKHHADHGW